MTVTHDPAAAAAGAGAPPPDEDSDDIPGDSGGPRWRDTIALMLVAALIAGAGVYWWQQRSPQPGRTDVGFYDDMTSHHLQAITMANTYIRNGRDPLLSQEAGEVSLGQAGDIRAMNLALESWGAHTSRDVAMEWMDMSVPQDHQPGMATDSQMARLGRSRGRSLDEQYSRLMILHHAGGIHMAAYAAAQARFGSVRKLAAQMAHGQRSEIQELNRWRVQNGFPAVPVPAGIL
jgi:uncharacterized protein (DUF305 family)